MKGKLQPGSFLYVRRVLRESETGSASAKLVLAAIADAARADGCSTLSYETIAARCELNERTVIRVVKQLEKRGLLTVQRIKTGKRNRTNRYTLGTTLRRPQAVADKSLF